MTDDKTTVHVHSKREWKGKSMKAGGAPGGAMYGLGFVGALIYYMQHAVTFWGVILGFLKALVWPAFLVYHVMQFLRM